MSAFPVEKSILFILTPERVQNNAIGALHTFVAKKWWNILPWQVPSHCHTYEFEPYKPDLEINSWIEKKKKKTRQTKPLRIKINLPGTPRTAPKENIPFVVDKMYFNEGRLHNHKSCFSAKLRLKSSGPAGHFASRQTARARHNIPAEDCKNNGWWFSRWNVANAARYSHHHSIENTVSAKRTNTQVSTPF